MTDFLKRFLEGCFIILTVFLGFFLESVREENEEIGKKDQLVSDLLLVIEDDIKQIAAVENKLLGSLKCLNAIQDDTDSNHSLLSDDQALDQILCVNVSTSFFPKDGVYAELVSTGSLELIENRSLKTALQEFYAHLDARNKVLSRSIDDLELARREQFNKWFRVRISYEANKGAFYGTSKVDSAEFDLEHYMSDGFYGVMTTVSSFSHSYLRLLDDIKKTANLISQAAAEEVAQNK